MKPLYAIFPLLTAAQIKFDSASFAGSGCRPDRQSLQYSPDEQSFTANAFDLFAGQGGSSPVWSNCDSTINLRFPVGCTVATFKFFHQGFGEIEKGLSGSLTNTFSISQGTISPTNPTPFRWNWDSFQKEHVFFYTTDLTARVTVQKGRELVTIVAKANMTSAQVPGDVQGDVSADNINFSIQSQKSC